MFLVRRHQISLSRHLQIVHRTLRGFNLQQPAACLAIVMLAVGSSYLSSLSIHAHPSQQECETASFCHKPPTQEVKGKCHCLLDRESLWHKLSTLASSHGQWWHQITARHARPLQGSLPFLGGAQRGEVALTALLQAVEPCCERAQINEQVVWKCFPQLFTFPGDFRGWIWESIA